MTNRTADLLVIGGGIHGCSAALHAAMRGLDVVVIEKDTVGRHASGVNAGGVRRLGRHYAEVPISQRSMEIWHRINELVDDDCGFQNAPQIKVAETEAELDTLASRAADLQTMGFALPYQTTFAFQRKAQSLGVRFEENCRVHAVARDGPDFRARTDRGDFTARNLVNCAGAWAGEIASQLGEPVPIEAIAPMMIVTQRMPHFCDAVVGGTGRPLSFKQMANGTVVIGGGRRGRARPADNMSEMIFGELQQTAETAIAIFPIMRGATIVRSWAGIEARMPDDIPVISPSSTHEGAYHAFGFSAHGFQMGPGVGEIMAELVCSGRTNAPIAPFSITRFAPGARASGLPLTPDEGPSA